MVTVNTILVAFTSFLDGVFPVAFGLLFVVFLFGMVKFILNADNEEGRRKGRSVMVWGVIALFVVAFVWGIVRLMSIIFGVDTNCPGTTIQIFRDNVAEPDPNAC